MITVTLPRAKGNTGERGPKGDKGETGATGPKGDQGAQGIQGLKGDKGDTGPQGLTGPKGDKGDTGAQGPKGDTGAQGAQGVKGDTGAKGDQGVQGVQGAQGLKGDTGWSPVFAVVADGDRRVLRVTDWTGGAGTKPATGSYVGPSGFVATPAEASNFRGAAGAGTGDMLAANNLSDLTDKAAARTALDVWSKGEIGNVNPAIAALVNGGDDAGLSWADGLNFQRDRHRLNSVDYAALMAVPGLTYTRTGSATAFRADGTLAEFAPNVPRITDRGVLTEGQRTNLAPRWDPNTAQVSLKVGCSDVGAPTIAPLSSRNWLALDNSTTAAYAYQSVTVPASTQFTAQCLVETPDGSQPVCDDGSSAATDFSLYAGGAWLQGGVASYRRLVGNVWVISVTGLTLPAPNVNFGPVRQATHSKRPLKFSGFQLEQASAASSPIITTGAPATRGVDRLYAADAIPKNDFTVLWETECAAPAGVSGWSLASDASVEAIVGGNQGFEDGLTGWGPSRSANPGAYTDANRPLFQSSYQGRAGAAVSTPGMGRRNFYSAKLFPIDTSRKYRIRTSIYVGPGGTALTYVGMRTLDASAMPPGGSGDLQYSVIGGSFLAENSGWTDRTSGILTGEGVASGNFNPGTKLIQLMAFLNHEGTPGTETAIDGIWLEDVTESEAAKVLPAQTIQIGARTPTSGTPISQRRRHALRKQGPTLTEYLNGVPIKNRQGSTYSNLLIGGAGLEPINGVVEAVKITPFAMSDAELMEMTR